jgi:hypothetical protein
LTKFANQTKIMFFTLLQKRKMRAGAPNSNRNSPIRQKLCSSHFCRREKCVQGHLIVTEIKTDFKIRPLFFGCHA